MNYHIVEISDRLRNSYSANTRTNIVWQWTIDNFGLPGQQPNEFRWQWDTNNKFFFTNEADAVLFALKWS